jgi:hypothetical protein
MSDARESLVEVLAGGPRPALTAIVTLGRALPYKDERIGK